MDTPIEESTVHSINRLRADIGIVQTGIVDGFLWKALMTTDAFVTTWTNGSEDLRKGQQYLNNLSINGFSFAKDYLKGYLPCDGLGGRKLSTALIKLIQANIGYNPSEASGNLGPATQNALPTLRGGNSPYITVAKLALLANGYQKLNTSSHWDPDLDSGIYEFQKDMSLPINSILDFSTWMALLISYGNKARSFNACDTRFEITLPRLLKLKEMDIAAVGRYINGTDFKVLRPGEVRRIIDGGLALFPIYQESGVSGDFFSKFEGKRQALEANRLAIIHEIPFDSIIYFAVDYDAQEDSIRSKILPYFEGVNEALLDYKVGVYGSRNVCQRVVSAQLSETCFVSNMSSGFSGNLGFKMPRGWNLDQFDEINISDWGIDKVTYSGAFGLVTKYDETVSTKKNYSIRTFIHHIARLEQIFIDYRNVNYPLDPTNPSDPNKDIHSRPLYEVILNLFRHKEYSGGAWNFSASSHPGYEAQFFNDLKQINKSVYDYIHPIIVRKESGGLQMIRDLNGDLLDIPHYFYTCLAHCKSLYVPTFWSGWGGDLITLASEMEVKWKNLNDRSISKAALAKELIGGDSTFNRPDVLADVDAVLIGNVIKSSALTLSRALTDHHLEGGYKKRFKNFADYVLPHNTEVSLAEYFDRTSNGVLENAIVAFKEPVTGDMKLIIKGLRPAFRGNATDEDITITCRAFAWYLKNEFI